jgi:signal transduction histidine kinase
LSTDHDPLPGSNNTIRETEKSPIHRIFTGVAGHNGGAHPRVYADKDGLPVTYTADQPAEKKIKPDEISVLWHELLSPMTVIKGYITTLLELDYAIDETQRKQYLRGIESASNRVIRLLENLRDVTRLEESDILVTRSASMVEIVKIIAAEVQSLTTKHVIKILPVPSSLPLVKVDPEKIQQVVNNLIVNAVKYSPQGGDIEVEMRLVRNEKELIAYYKDSPPFRLPALVISVADSGVGIPEGELERIFERFYRVNHKVIRATPGVGLGLYVSRLIVETHGGQIWARNRYPAGSVFRFSLPVERIP